MLLVCGGHAKRMESPHDHPCPVHAPARLTPPHDAPPEPPTHAPTMRTHHPAHAPSIATSPAPCHLTAKPPGTH